MPQRRRVLVTGATGTVGRHVVTQLVTGGVEVRALVRDPVTAGLPNGADVQRGDLRDPESLAGPLEGATDVFLVWPFASAEGAATCWTLSPPTAAASCTCRPWRCVTMNVRSSG